MQQNPSPLYRRSMFYDMLVLLLLALVGGFFRQIPVTAVVYIIIGPTLLDMAEQLRTGTLTEEQYFGQLQTELLNAMQNEWVVIVSLLSSVLVVGVVLFWCRKIRKQPLSDIGLSTQKALPRMGLGCLLGIACALAAVGLPLLLKAATLSPSDAVSPVRTVLVALGLLLAGVEEEVLFRGYLFMEWRRTRPLWQAVVFSSLVFIILNATSGMNFLSYINMFLLGCVLALLCHLTGNIVCSMCLHGISNLLIGCVFGGTISGTVFSSRLFAFAATEGRELTSGGAAGPESGLGMTLILVVVLFILLWRIADKKEKANRA